MSHLQWIMDQYQINSLTQRCHSMVLKKNWNDWRKPWTVTFAYFCTGNSWWKKTELGEYLMKKPEMWHICLPFLQLMTFTPVVALSLCSDLFVSGSHQANCMALDGYEIINRKKILGPGLSHKWALAKILPSPAPLFIDVWRDISTGLWRRVGLLRRSLWCVSRVWAHNHTMIGTNGPFYWSAHYLFALNWQTHT